MAKHNETGKWGEEIAKEFLIVNNYTIRETNWRLHHYELDIIATKGDRIIFVEVKTRSTDFADPLSAINKAKISRIIRSANAYIKMFHISLNPQFDIINIIGNPSSYRIEHIVDAFWAPLSTK